MKKYYQLVTQITYMGFLLVVAFAISSFRSTIPDQLYVVRGEQVSYDFGVPVSVVLKEDSTEALGNANEGVSALETPSYTVSCRLFGIFPVKDVEVMMVDGTSVFASGMPIGIYAKTDGILVIGTGAVTDEAGKEQRPAEKLVKAGDYIASVNGETVMEKEELVEAVAKNGGKKVILGIRRDEETIEVSVTPVKSSQGSYMLGIWVRDDLAGVGTLTYYDKEKHFGALGHAVSDSDTGTLMEISDGWIYTTKIIGIRKGEKGSPGELSGLIDYRKEYCLGTISDNTPLGIHGELDGDLKKLETGTSYEVTYKQDIRLGTAYIISSVSGESQKYEINIESLDFSGQEENKGILFQVTDPKLLELTGGIVQGMSGAPIVQNGKIIGAVTHVLVQDSTRGYGIFIENMLEH